MAAEEKRGEKRGQAQSLDDSQLHPNFPLSNPEGKRKRIVKKIQAIANPKENEQVKTEIWFDLSVYQLILRPTVRCAQ